MRLDQAMMVMEQYARDHNIDDLTAVERMVNGYQSLTNEQQQALGLFMAEIKKDLV